MEVAYRKQLDEYLEKIDSVIENGRYKDNWESLSAYPVPTWYKNAKFGVFLHWGVYSVPAYYSEWYPRLMYYKGNPVYWHHKKKYGKDFNYRDFVPMFKAEKFDAEKWVSILKSAGAKYIMPVGEHHDGYKMYDSDLSQWTSVKQAPHCDILGELKKECDKQGVTFATSSHRAEHFWFLNGGRTVGYDNEVLDEKYRDFYGPAHNIHKINNLHNLLKQEHGITPTKEWLEDWLVNSCELIDKYHPETLFFDWWVMNYAFRPYMKKFLAYYYNRSVEWDKEVCVQYKSDAIMYNVGIFDRERGQLAATSPYIWQSETSTAYNSWSYCTTNKFKTASKIAGTFVDVISKNGNFVLNLGPKADGTFCEEEMQILEKLSDWTAKNKEAIWGTQPYKIFGEGKKHGNGSFNEKYNYSRKDYRFTYKTGSIYIFALKPDRTTFKIKSLKYSGDMFAADIKSVEVLGYNQNLHYERNNRCLKIELDSPIETDMPLCFKVSID